MPGYMKGTSGIHRINYSTLSVGNLACSCHQTSHLISQPLCHIMPGPLPGFSVTAPWAFNWFLDGNENKVDISIVGTNGTFFLINAHGVLRRMGAVTEIPSIDAVLTNSASLVEFCIIQEQSVSSSPHNPIQFTLVCHFGKPVPSPDSKNGSDRKPAKLLWP